MVDFVSLFTGMSERDIGYLLKTIVQDSINSELTNSEITEIDEKTPVLITNSKDVELMNDISIQSAINIEPTTTYLMPEEPDGVNLKLWLKFQNAGELRDWSYQKNKSFATGGNTMPGLFSKHNDDSMLKYELYSYFNGLSHYAHTLDAPAVRISNNILSNKTTSFFIRLIPISLAKLQYAENNALFTKVDDDQLRYGYSVTIDYIGNIHFYIRDNYTQYHLCVVNAYNYILTDPMYNSGSNFRFDNFSKKNFLTGFQFLCGLVDVELPFHDWFFKYNPSTHNMSVINTGDVVPATVVADTSLISQLPYISCPIQEGRWTHLGTAQTTIYDSSGNNNNATLTGLTESPGGTWNDDNTLTSLGSNSGGTDGSISIDFSNISGINTLTEFTICFWFNPLDELINNKSYNTRMVTKGYAVADSIYIERTTGVNNIKFSFRKADNIEQTVTFSNPFTSVNKWYFVVCKWKSGEKLKISVNNVEVQSGSNISGTLSTASKNLQIHSPSKAPIGILSLFKFYTVQISQATQDDLYYQGYHNPLFPKSENIQPVVQENPDPIFIPFTNAYTLDKMPTPTLADYRRINSLSGSSPFIERYNVPGGVSVTDPELNPYVIADGTGGAGSPFVIIQGPGTAGTTIESSDSSNGILGDVSSGNERIAVRIKTTGATVGANLLGKVITRAQFDLRRIGSVTGTVYAKIWNAAGAEVATIGSVPASSLTDGTYTLTNFQNLSQTVTIPAGAAGIDWRIGVEYITGASGDEVQVRRKSGDLDGSVNQDSWDWDGSSWNSSGNNLFEVKCNLYTGQGTTSSDPNIIMKSGSYNRVTEAFGSTDPIMGKVIGKITLRLKKVGSPTGTATIGLMNNASPPVMVAAFSPTINVSSLTTTTADYTVTNYTHGIVTGAGHRIGIQWTPSASGEVHVMTNLGNTGGGNSWQGTTSYILNYISGWSSNTSIDLAGKIYTGGNDFESYYIYKNGISRIATKAVNSASSLHNQKITKMMVKLGRIGNPSGMITAVIRDPNDVIKVQFSSLDVSTIPSDGNYHDYEFINVTHNYLINSALGSGDKISFECPSGNDTNLVTIYADRNIADGLNTITQLYNGINYIDDAQRDLAGIYYTGGEPDLVSRTRVVQSIEHQNSILKGKKITRVKAFLIRTLVATIGGTVFCNIRRGSDNSLIKTLGTVPLSSLSTTPATPSEITFENTTNNYPLNVGDKVSIEFNGGNTSDQLGVLVREVTPNYDLTNSYIRKYDEVDYDDEEPTKDLCAVMDEGGFFFTPDPFSIPDPTPTNIKDLLYCAGNNAKSGFFETFLMEFRIYAKDITLTNANNLYSNRYTISPIGRGEILMPFSLKANTLDPV